MKKQLRKCLATLVAGAMLFSGIVVPQSKHTVEAAEADTTYLTTDRDDPRSGNIFIEIPGTLKKQDIQAAIDRINEIRKEACDNGYPYPDDGNGTQLSTKLTSENYVPIKWSQGMEKLAIIRAAEYSIHLGHVRPNSSGEHAYNMPAINKTKVWLENLAANPSSQTNLVTSINQWYKEKDAYVNGGSGYGHYQLMINPKITCFGMGQFYNKDSYYKNYTSGLFSHSLGSDDLQTSFNYNGDYIQLVEISNSYVSSINIVGSGICNIGDTETFYANAVTSFDNNYTAKINKGITWSSSDTGVATIDAVTGEFTAKSIGETTITASMSNGKGGSFDVLVLPSGVSFQSIQQPEMITVDFNTKPVLPDKVACILSNGETIDVNVKWDSYDTDNLFTHDSSKEFIITGSILDQTVEQKIHVNPAKITKVYTDDLEITVDAGTKPSYQNNTSYSLENGWSYSTYSINWDRTPYHMDPHGGDYRVKGTFNIYYDGEALPYEIYTNLHVNPATLTGLTPDETEITVDSGTAPTLPIVRASWSIDVEPTIEDIEWEDTEPSYEYSDPNDISRKYFMRDGGDYTIIGSYGDKTTEVTVHVNRATIEAISYPFDTDALVVESGEMPELPESAKVSWSNGDVSTEPIFWESISPDSYNVIEGNSFTVNGTCKGQNVSVDVTVHPAYIKAYDDLEEIEVIERIAPVLPEKVNIHWSNGMESEEEVTWDEIDKSLYSQPGTFEAYGYVTANDEQYQIQNTIKVVPRTPVSVELKNGGLTEDTTLYSYDISEIKGTIIVTYDNQEKEEIDINESMIYGLDESSKENEQSIKIHYKESDLDFYIPVTVYMLSRTGIRISSLPSTLDYIEGYELDIAGIEVEEILSDGSTRTIEPYEYSVEDFIYESRPETYGTNTVTLNLYGFSTTYDINVREKALKSISIIETPEKLEYVEGQTFDYNGISIYGYYDNGDEEILDSSLAIYSINASFDEVAGKLELTDIGSDVNTETIGSQTVYVIYENPNEYDDVDRYIYNTFNIDIIPREVTHLDWNQLPTVLEFPKDDITFADYNFSDGIITAHYNDATLEFINLTDTEISNFDITTIGKQTVNVYFGGHFTTFTATVRKPELTDIRVTGPDATSYAEGEFLDLTGLKLTYYYDNGLSETVDIDEYSSDISISFEDNSDIHSELSKGNKTLIVKYKNNAVATENDEPIIIHVSERVAIRVKTMPAKLEYPEGTSLDLTGLQLESVFADNTTKLIPESDYNISSDTDTFFENVGSYTINLEAYGLKTAFDITARTKRITELSLDPSRIKSDYAKGQPLDITGLKVTANYDNGTSGELSCSNNGITDITLDNIRMNVTATGNGTSWNTNTIGKNTMYVVIKEAYTDAPYIKAPFTVTVEPKVARSISIKTYPTTTTIPQNDTGYNSGTFADGVLNVTNNCNYMEEIGFGSKGVVISDFDISRIGLQTVTVSYGRAATTFEVEVTKPEITELSVTAPDKTSYAKGEDIDLAGAEVILELNNGQTRTFDLTDANDMDELKAEYDIDIVTELFDVSGNSTDTSSTGSKALVVKYVMNGVSQQLDIPGGNISIDVHEPVIPDDTDDSSSNDNDSANSGSGSGSNGSGNNGSGNSGSGSGSNDSGNNDSGNSGSGSDSSGSGSNGSGNSGSGSGSSGSGNTDKHTSKKITTANGTQFIKADGNPARSEWVTIDGVMYYFNDDTFNASSEWRDGKWINADGSCTYEGILQWKSNSTGWWVEDSAGWYPVSSWQKIDGIWYYFNSSGYMASGEYYNGYWFNSDGSWNSMYYLSWKSNSTGWWVEDEAGWWPVNSWLKIDGYWYYFDSNGYMVTNQYIDGWWIGSDGVCY